MQSNQQYKRRVLVTGGIGFIGYHLAASLSDNPETEVVLADSANPAVDDVDLARLLNRPNVSLVSGDLAEAIMYERIGRGYDEVYHLAAIVGVRAVLERPHEVLRVNALTTLKLLDWFVQGGGEKLLFSSTSEAYAWTQSFYPVPVPTPEDVPLALTNLDNPRLTYAASKIHGELAVRQFCKVFNKRSVIVRYHNVYGPRMGYKHVIPELHKRAMDGENPLTVYSPEHRRAFCYVSDAVSATLAAMRQTAADSLTINIGNDKEEVSIAELAQRLLRVAGIDAPLRPESAPNDPIVRRCPDLTCARTVLNYEPRVSLDQGLKRTLGWYADRDSSALPARKTS